MRTCLLAVLAVGCDGGSESRTATTRTVGEADLVRTAERGPVRLRARIDRAEVTVPERLTLTVTVESERGVDVVMPDPGESFGEFGIAESKETETVSDGVTVRREHVFALEGFIPGTYDVPSITVAFSDRREKADGSRTIYEDTVTTDPITVLVKAGLADVKGPVTLPMPGWQKILWWAIGAVAVMVGVALLARWWRRRRAQREREQPLAMRLAAHEWALAELDKLAAEDLIGRGQVQAFYYRINALLRRYIELRFHLMAGEQTSEEFVRSFQDSPVFDENHKEVLRRFVRACDPVKYARHQPEPGDIDWVQAAARDFVLETAESAVEPVKEPPALAGGQSPDAGAGASRASSESSSISRGGRE